MSFEIRFERSVRSIYFPRALKTREAAINAIAKHVAKRPQYRATEYTVWEIKKK